MIEDQARSLSRKPTAPVSAEDPTGAWLGWDTADAEYPRIAWSLFAAGFATFALVFDAQAALPALASAFDTSSAAASLTVSATSLGLASSVLVWSWVADRIGRVTAMRISLIAALMASFTLGLADQLWQLIALRALLGVALGAVPGVTMAYLAEELVSAQVSIAAGIFVAGNTVGGIFGRLCAGFASALWGWRVAFLLVAFVAVAMAAGFLFAIPAPRGFVPGRDSARTVLARVRFQLRDPVMLALYAQGLFLMGSFGAVYNFLGFRLLAAPFSLPATVASLVFVAYFAGTAASRSCGVLARRWGRLPTILGGIAAMLVGTWMMVSQNLAVVLAGLVVFTVGCFTAHPLASGLTGQLAKTGRAQATALYQLAWLGGTALFGALAGLAYDRWGWPSVLSLVSVLCLAAGSAALTGLRCLTVPRAPR